MTRQHWSLWVLALFLTVAVNVGNGWTQPTNNTGNTNNETSPPESAQPKAVQIVKTGSFHGSDVSAKNGETWMGLFKAKKAGQFELRSVTLKVETVVDPIVDDEELNEKTGIKISIPNESSEPLLLIKNAEELQAGPVQTLRSSFTTFLNPNETIKKQHLKLDKSNTLLVDALLITRKTIKRNKRLMLTFIEGDVAQMLNIPSILSGSGGQAGLIWVGDLDGDGYLDLIMNLSHHYNVTNISLFLSSQASAGNLIKKVAEWITTGC